MMSLKMTFLGAAQEVTGSILLLEVGSRRILVDCGFVQGRRQESRQRNRELPIDAKSIDAVILTHAHIDHSGSLPTLVKAGFAGSIYATPATRALCAHMLRDSARIQVADAEYMNRKFADDPHYDQIEPVYDEDDAIRTLEHFVTEPYRHRFDPLPQVTASFLDAGHILGSAQVLLDIACGRGRTRLLISGDLGRRGLPVIRDPDPPPPDLDYVVMESTYGNRLHGRAEQMDDELERVLRDAIQRGGKVVVPAFALGRTQELLFSLHTLKRAGRLPDIPVFIDSPLAINVTEVFRLHPECFDHETRVLLEDTGDALGFENVTFVTSREESIGLNSLRGPATIISAAGMAEGGRVLHHLRNTVEDRRNTILVVGFMAQHTLGRRLVERRPRVRIWGVERELRARVEVLDSFSAHADRNDLLDYVRACGTTVKRFHLVHGEPEQQEPLRKAMTAQGATVLVPRQGDVVALEPG